MSTTTQPPKPKRRWYQFSMRTLLVVVVVFCVWLGIRVQRARTNRARVAAVEEAVAKITKLGGEVYSNRNFFYQSSRPDGGRRVQQRSPTWLEELFHDPGGPDDPVEVLVVREVTFYSTKVTNAELGHLKGLTNLQVLTLGNTQITDAGLERLKGLTKLETLYLGGTKVTDEGVKKLQQALPNCRIRH